MDGSKPKSSKKAAAGDMPNPHLRDLRSSLDWLKSKGDLIVTDKEVDPDLQITGLQKLMDGGCPVLFNNVKGKPNHRIVTNLFGDMQAMNRMFGWTSDKARTIALAKAIKQTLRAAIRAGGSSLRDFVASDGEHGCFQTRTQVYDREGEACRRCKGKIRRIVQGQRATYFCPGCQR